ncbi:NUDIX domain-containing protein [Streptomyces sp. PTY087I2]|uniref:NUDIX domain-containing protein n=1 Tax=Streptomyces sp. PTY087I2 TaxID=1819298 RepID=UPI00080BBF43|nr:NUDIX domain-containing protein [Streptomyces sp. PTY087I2]OCC08538.1 8-oxo-dGTP diphosphatase [Streptomyces sp. PTY087I2]
MTAETRPLTVLFDADKLILELRHDAEGAYHAFPGGLSAAADAPRVALPLAEALHARIRPAGTAETVLRAWSEGAAPEGPVALVDPAAVEPVRVRAGAVVIRDGAVLLIRFTDEDGSSHYEIPGGGVEEGETPETAVVRELDEETGLTGTVGPQVARVWKDGRHEHYFLVSATGEVGPPETLDNYGGTPVWVPVDRLPATPLWPRRLSWRIEHWHRTGWPERPAELADSITELGPPCGW